MVLLSKLIIFSQLEEGVELCAWMQDDRASCCQRALSA